MTYLFAKVLKFFPRKSFANQDQDWPLNVVEQQTKQEYQLGEGTLCEITV